MPKIKANCDEDALKRPKINRNKYFHSRGLKLNAVKLNAVCSSHGIVLSII